MRASLISREVIADSIELAAVRDGDMITLDVGRRALDLELSDDELAARLAAWTAPVPRYRRGVFARYAASVGSASEGATT